MKSAESWNSSLVKSPGLNDVGESAPKEGLIVFFNVYSISLEPKRALISYEKSSVKYPSKPATKEISVISPKNLGVNPPGNFTNGEYNEPSS